jgi:hypothetical protein
LVTQVSDAMRATTALDATKLTGNLPAISGASLTSLTAGNLTGNLPAISGASLTGLPASGGLITLASTTISTPVAAVAFNSTYINSTYDNYKVVFHGLAPSADNQDLGLLMSVDNGSSFATHVGGHMAHLLSGTATYYTGSTSYITFGVDEESSTDGNVSGYLDIFGVNSTTQFKFATGQCLVKNQDGTYYYYTIYGYIGSTTAVNYVKVFTSVGGNLATGTVTLYGYAKS